MKVISGKAKGRNLKMPKQSTGKRIRPLTGRVKEALFNILANRIDGVRFLDLFAGTGAVGIEALSRGACIAFFVEKDLKVVQALRENLDATGFSDKAEVYCLDVLKAIQVMDNAGGKFDIVFIGAPYGDPVLEATLKSINNASILDNKAIVIAEHSARSRLADTYGRLIKYRDAKYGDTVLSFYS